MITRINLSEHHNVPVICCACLNQSILKHPNPIILDALHDSSTLKNLDKEWELLQKAEKLFEQFPCSLHRQRVTKLEIPLPPESDSTFDMALDSDPALKEFLTQHNFSLPVQMKLVQTKIGVIKNTINRSAITCMLCNNGILRLDDQFFKCLGSGAGQKSPRFKQLLNGALFLFGLAAGITGIVIFMIMLLKRRISS